VPPWLPEREEFLFEAMIIPFDSGDVLLTEAISVVQ
jgi:hypothetical protein